MGSSDMENEQNGKEIFATVNTLEPPQTVDDKAMVRKIDRKVVPMLFLMFFAAFLDRVGIGNALTFSLPKDLNLQGNQINTVLTIFFVPYVVFEIPSNLVLKKVKPHNWLTFCIVSFGFVMLAQGWVQNYGGIITTRFLLGLFECGIFPGSFYLLSFWYAREEAQKRFTIYWCSVLVAISVGGLIATGIAKLDGHRGLANWRWIFIIEGIITIVIGIAAWFFVVDFPDQANFFDRRGESMAYEEDWPRPRARAFCCVQGPRDILLQSAKCYWWPLIFFHGGANICFLVFWPNYRWIPWVLSDRDPIACYTTSRGSFGVGDYTGCSL